MEAISIVTGIALPLPRSNIDTDQIIPAAFMKRVTKTGYADALFHAWREDPQFVLNRAEYAAAKILVAGPNFGTGSSREHAVWALRDYGISAVVSTRFADIFRGNAGKQGLLAVEVTEEDIAQVWAVLDAEPGRDAVVDLVQRTMRLGDLAVPFQIDDYTRWRLLEGLDDIGLTLRHEDAIARFEARRPAWLPATLPPR